jgi:Outer membrane lipoprotein-sorting protein
MKIFLFFFAFLFSFNCFSVDVKALLQKVDDLYRSEQSYAEVQMTIVTPDWERTMEMVAWSKGTKKTFIRIISPKKDEGIATLKIENEMWNFFPKIDKIIKIPSSMMMASWMGSDFTNDDLVKEYRFSVDYDSTVEDQKENYLITLKPHENIATIWGRIEVLLDKKTELPSESTYFDEKGKKIRVMYFKERKIIDNKNIPMVMELVSLNKEGHKTVVKYKTLSFTKDVPEKLFSQKNLQERK